MNCPNDEKLAMLSEGRLAAVELELIEAHLDRCASCRTLVAAASNGSVPAAVGGVTALKAGDRLGHYEIERWLATGGMGVLYVARDTQLNRRVALKLMRSTLGDEIAHVRLLREAQAMAALNHPNVLQVFELGEFEGRVFVAMEFVEGGTLRGWMKRPHPWREVVEVFVLIGHGLQAAHEHGVVHRDFKPENVLMGDNRPRVGDFGLSRPAPSLQVEPATPVSMRVTNTGMMLGTPAYMSPEQLEGRSTDAATDQYSFCVCLYEALTSRRPFSGKSVEELKASVRQEMPIPGGHADVPKELWKILGRGLAVNPPERFSSMAALLVSLSNALAPRVEAQSFQRRALWPTVIAACALTAAGATFALVGPGSTHQELQHSMVPSTGFQTAGLQADKESPVEKVEISPVTLRVGQTKKLMFEQNFSRVAIGAPEVADASAIEGRLEFVGKAVGETTAIVWLDDGRRLSFTVSVRP